MINNENQNFLVIVHGHKVCNYNIKIFLPG